MRNQRPRHPGRHTYVGIASSKPKSERTRRARGPLGVSFAVFSHVAMDHPGGPETSWQDPAIPAKRVTLHNHESPQCRVSKRARREEDAAAPGCSQCAPNGVDIDWQRELNDASVDSEDTSMIDTRLSEDPLAIVDDGAAHTTTGQVICYGTVCILPGVSLPWINF